MGLSGVRASQGHPARAARAGSSRRERCPMSLKKRLRTLCACVVLEMGVLLGVPVRVEQVEDLLRSLSQPKVARTDPQEADRDAE
jgi:hypothetical protein